MNSSLQYVHIFFIDGIGLGSADRETNPFVRANLPHLNGLLGEGWFLRNNGRFSTARATFIPTDATLGVPGRPQSATGQAAILTGRNIPQLLGEHYGPKPNPPIMEIITAGTLFHEVIAAGGRAALLNPYPEFFFDAITRGKQLLSAVPLAASLAGLPLLTTEDLRDGRAISPDFTNQGWHDLLGLTDMPVLTCRAAGQRLAQLAAAYQFSFFDHWLSDRHGHRGDLNTAAAHLQQIDATLGGVLDAWDDARGLLIITSDHGNVEEKDHRQHTRNPVPTILVGAGHAHFGSAIQNLADIAGVVRAALGLPLNGL